MIVLQSNQNNAEAIDTEICFCLVASMGMGGGYVPMIVQQIPYGISSYASNAMLSSNPNSGVYEADTARTLDALKCGDPSCNQGGVCIVMVKENENNSN